jgi:hypothetical protein
MSTVCHHNRNGVISAFLHHQGVPICVRNVCNFCEEGQELVDGTVERNARCGRSARRNDIRDVRNRIIHEDSAVHGAERHI